MGSVWDQGRELAAWAQEAGIGITAIFDGLDECPEPLRAEFLQQVSAFQLRIPSSVVVTSTIAGPSHGPLSLHTLRLRDPDDDARLRILAVHGATHPERISPAFQTPYELSVAAACEGELSSHDGTPELHDAYIRRFAPTEQLRSGLRAIATLLHEQLRSTAPARDAIALLGSAAGLGWTPAEIDELLGCRLLVVERNKIRFRHELVSRHLAAEDLVRRSPNGRHLGRALSTPANNILQRAALAAETDVRRRWEALEELGEVDLFVAALTGDFGSATSTHATREIRRLINKAIAATNLSNVEFVAGDAYSARWKSGRRWSPAEQAMLAAVGVALPTGRFVDEITRLADLTDELCLHYASDLHKAGAPTPVSTIVAATYTQLAKRDDKCLPISIIATACELDFMGRRHENRAGSVAARLGDTDRQRPWGRLYLAALTVNPASSEDQAAFPHLLRRAWNAGGYHLRLEILQAARFFGRTTSGSRKENLAVLRALEPDNWALSTMLVEALAAFGDIISGVSPAELRANIREVLADSSEPTHWKLASGIVSNQFEDEDIVGPYCEAIQGLQRHEQVQLLCMAARGAEHSLHLSWTLRELARLTPTGQPRIDIEAQDVFRSFLRPPSPDSFLPTESVAAWIAALYGWTRFADTLPPHDAEPTDDGLAWRLLARLVFLLANPTATDDPEPIWRTVRLRCAHEAVDALHWLRTAAAAHPWKDWYILPKLASRFPEQLCALLEGSLGSGDESVATGHHAISRHRFVIDLLGEVGTPATVELLRQHTVDPDTGGPAVAAIRRIHERTR